MKVNSKLEKVAPKRYQIIRQAKTRNDLPEARLDSWRGYIVGEAHNEDADYHGCDRCLGYSFSILHNRNSYKFNRTVDRFVSHFEKKHKP